MSAGPSLPSRAFADSSPISRASCEHAFLVGVADHRHDQAVRRVGREADVEVLLQDQVLAVERGVELGKLAAARRRAALIRNASIVTLMPAFSFSLLSCDAEGLELGDVGFVELRDVRDHHPVAVQVRARDLLDARQRLRLDRPELREVDLRPRQQVERRRRRCRAAARAARPPPAPASRSPARLPAGCGPSGPLPVTLREIDAELARERAHRRDCVRCAERALRRPAPRRAGAARVPAAATRRGAGAAGVALARRGCGERLRRCGAAAAARRAGAGCGAGAAAAARRRSASSVRIERAFATPCRRP